MTAVLIGAALLTGLAGCGSTEGGAAATRGAAGPEFNQADLDFAVQMSSHHSQALQMTELARTRARSAKVKQVAAEIEAGHGPQVDRFAVLIARWAAAGGVMPPHRLNASDPAQPAGPGLLPEDQVTKLASARGAAFDRAFLTLMIRHHEAGLPLIDDVIRTGRAPDARRLAQQIRAAAAAQLDDLARARRSLR